MVWTWASGDSDPDPPIDSQLGQRGQRGRAILMPMSEALMLQALESTADQIDHLAEIIDEFLIMAEAGVPMSATTRQRYATEMVDLRGHRAQVTAQRIGAYV